MGCMLSAPVGLIRVQRHGSASFTCGVAEMQGWRKGHEDAHHIGAGEKHGDFWVLDGHGGEHAAQFAAPQLGKDFAEAMSGGSMPSDQRIQDGLTGVDQLVRAHFKEHPEKESGSTVVGALARVQQDGTYALKLVNCGDSRAIVFHGPAEQQESSPEIETRVPGHLLDLCDQEDQVAKGNAAKLCSWPLVQETIDHKPSHPTEAARIVAAGGHVTEDEPPRVDGNLAVSRGLGDFEFKSNTDLPVEEQKVSCIPDVYEVRGVRSGGFCVLCCDGVWDVMSAEDVCQLVLDAAKADLEHMDVGSIAAKIVQTSLDKNSRDNVTAMVIHLQAAKEWITTPPVDEMKGFEPFMSEENPLDTDVKKEYSNFLRKTEFPPEPCPCQVCGRWFNNMQQCPCKQVFYCTKACQKKGWKKHKAECPLAKPSKGA